MGFKGSLGQMDLQSKSQICWKFVRVFPGRLYAMQTGMKLDSKTPECRKFLVKLMDQLETMKKELSDNESISQEIVGNAHVENYAIKMFLYADSEDRSGHFHKSQQYNEAVVDSDVIGSAVLVKGPRAEYLAVTQASGHMDWHYPRNMIKSFYTSSLLFDVLSVFGELSEENIQHRKYAKWKAAYIHNCLKNGETPQPGPIGMEGEAYDDEFGAEGGGPSQAPYDPPQSQPSFHGHPSNQPPASNFSNIQIPPGSHAPANTPADIPHPEAQPIKPVPVPRAMPVVDPSLLNNTQEGDLRLTPEDFTRAQKYCKYAGSALQYEDVGTAVQNLQKALKLLTTGKE
ncbi:hypothetical protein PO909_010360 [Leuciscus waleckii]